MDGSRRAGRADAEGSRGAKIALCSKGAQGTFKLEPVGDPLDDRFGFVRRAASSRSCPDDFWQAKVIARITFSPSLSLSQARGRGPTISSSALRREPANQEDAGPRIRSMIHQRAIRYSPQ